MVSRARRYRQGPLLCCYLLLPSVLKSGIDGFRVGRLKRPCTTPYPAKRTAWAALSAMDEDQGQHPRFSSVADLEALTVKQLKSYLKAYDLKRTGRKAELVQFLAESLGLPTETRADDLAEGTTPAPEKAKTDAPTELLPVTEEIIRKTPRGRLRFPELVMDAEMAQSKDMPEPVQDSPLLSSSLSLRPPPTDDMERRNVIQDLMERRNMKFNLEEAFNPDSYANSEPAPEGDMYAVFTNKAVRPWDGPHADRAETHLVVLLSDVMGWEDPYTRNVADQVAEICDAIVLVPDIFRGRPWALDQQQDGYEAWRASHDPETVSSDIRACVDHARVEFKPTSLALMGFCYGGGRVLEEAAAGVVKPDDVVAFYPTRYNIQQVAANIVCPVAVFFAEEDVLPGATPADACALREGLLKNNEVRDFQLRLCPGTEHGFVHRPQVKDRQNAEDAMLLATSWLDMYMAKYFPAKGGEIKYESNFGFWDLPARAEVVSTSSAGGNTA